MALARGLREAVLRHARFGPVAASLAAPALCVGGASVAVAAAGPSSSSGSLLARAVRAFGASTYLDKDQVTQRVLGVVKNFDKVDPAKVTPAASFASDLGLDSLDAVELVMALEEEFGVEIPDAEADKILSTGEAIAYLAAHPQAK